MPSIEVGAVGGGTVLGPQQAILDMLGLKGAHRTYPGQNSRMLARLISAAVMAGELSVLSALAADQLVRARLAHNRLQTNIPAASQPELSGASPTTSFLGSSAIQRGLTSLSDPSLTISLPPYSADGKQ